MRREAEGESLGKVERRPRTQGEQNTARGGAYVLAQYCANSSRLLQPSSAGATARSSALCQHAIFSGCRKVCMAPSSKLRCGSALCPLPIRLPRAHSWDRSVLGLRVHVCQTVLPQCLAPVVQPEADEA